ncbi:MAG: restriction endonuclease [Prolixibacteraceae bacterium]|nr:restriction endonuclease [Prolixibacteraceae bacterium]
MFCGEMILGYRTRVTPEGPDGGVGIIAYKDELGLEPPIIKVQVKSNDSDISRKSTGTVRQCSSSRIWPVQGNI